MTPREAETIRRMIAESITPEEEQILDALAAIHKATDGATDGCGLFEAVTVLISQRDNARHYEATYRKRLKELGEEYV